MLSITVDHPYSMMKVCVHSLLAPVGYIARVNEKWWEDEKTALVEKAFSLIGGGKKNRRT